MCIRSKKGLTVYIYTIDFHLSINLKKELIRLVLLPESIEGVTPAPTRLKSVRH